MGGLNAAVQLKHAGIDFTVLEKNPGVGGTWFENTYPGARVDSPSRTYTHIFGVGIDLANPVCDRDENQRYFNRVADDFDVRRHIVFDTEVVSLRWDEDDRDVGGDGKGARRPAGVASERRDQRGGAAVPSEHPRHRRRGRLQRAGRSTRRAGPRTSTWPACGSASSERDARGSSWFPSSRPLTGHVVVFQRSPQWLFDRKGYRAPYPPQVTWLDRNFPYFRNFMRFRAHWLMGPYLSGPLREVDPTFEHPHARSAVNKRLRDQRIAFIERKFASRPDLMEKMIPDLPPFARRPVQVDTDYCYYDALLRDDVTLVTDGHRADHLVGDTDGRRHRARARRDRLRHRVQGERVPLAH